MSDELVTKSAEIRIVLGTQREVLSTAQRDLDNARRAIVEITHKYAAVVRERDNLRKFVGHPRACDKCAALANWECKCSRCSREPDEKDRFFTCGLHKDIVTESHERIRGRPPVWVSKITI